MGESFTVNSEQSLKFFISWATNNFHHHKFSTYGVRHGADRSIDQNALLHVWCTEYAAHLLSKNKKDVSRGELNGMKRTAKRHFYNEHGYDWMVEIVVDPFTGNSKKDFTSSADWKTPEMFEFLTWLQLKAMNDGLLLESKGKFRKLQEQQNAA